MATGKLPQGDSRWATFNDSFVNQELQLLDVANFIFKGHAYTTWHSGRRSIEKFICGQHIAVDMDTGDARSTIDVLSKHPLVRLYGGLIHTTPSHTDDAPRARVIFFLDKPIESALGYTAAATFLMSQFDGSDEACKDASRFFYGAKDCEIWFQESEFPVNHLRRYFKLWERTQPQQKQRTTNDSKIVNLQEYRQAKHTEQENRDELEKVRDALCKIDPYSVDYNRWIGILAALKREFGDSALPIAEEWAKGQPGEVQREWEKHLKRGSGKQTGLGTIYYLASGA